METEIQIHVKTHENQKTYNSISKRLKLGHKKWNP